ncbi:hypothetical protein KJ987_08615 [bacterium]|nr:hypothetical protein [bacterium]
MEKTIRKNENCFIGMPSCGYGYESAKSCFLACPSQEKYALVTETIMTIIESKQYECHIALKKIDPGNFAFCTKICSKIIQSQFCIVLLDPSPGKTSLKECPNPNVHLEYGMMIGQNKHIIPLQDEKYVLAFNIFPLDTIKYNPSNLKIKVTEAIDNAIARAIESTTSGQIPPGPEIFTFYSMSGYLISDVTNVLLKYIFNLGSSLGFYLFNNYKEMKYKFIGPFEREDPKKAILHTKLLIDNIISTYIRTTSNIPKDNKVELKKFEYLLKGVSIDLIIPPFYEKEEVGNKIKSIKDKEYEFPFIIHYRNDIKNFVEDQYKKIGDLKVIKNKNS